MVLYVRISDDPEGTEKGVERQEADCRDYAESLGFEVVEVFRENDTLAFKQRTITLPTGEKVRRVVRPRFRAMLSFLTQGRAEAMIAYDLDRAVRDPRDLEDLIDAKVLYGFRVLSTTGSLRLDNDSDIAMARVLVEMANKSSADTARRVARASKQQAIDGKWHGGRAPYGYRMGDSTLYVVPEQAALVREAADRLLAGESVYAIIQRWHRRGESSALGKRWTESALVRIMRNPALKGARTYLPMLPDGSRSTVPETVTDGNWTPILDVTTWQRVNDVLAARTAKSQGGPGAIKRVYPFTGLIRCAECGTAMYRQGDFYTCGNKQFNTCHRSVKMTEVTALVEDAVLSVFSRLALTPETLPARDGSETERAHDELSVLIDSDRTVLNRLDDDHYDGLIDRATWARQRSRLTERISTRQREYQQHLARKPVLDVDIDLGTVASEWAERTAQWKYDAASIVLEAVLIHGHPKGVSPIVSRRRDEPDETYQARLREHRQSLLARRVEFVWCA
ncbi:recombinase family protein [Kytococcus sedentarius]|uniref:recombinase family protein n=1 Tax=Kytococcus sedentarius TaxID=1276 RepID=UPI0038795CD7